MPYSPLHQGDQQKHVRNHKWHWDHKLRFETEYFHCHLRKIMSIHFN